MDTFGDFLKASREKKGIRLEEIASITKIHLHSLELLEAGAWKSLPPEPFIRGFITAYAKYVGLDLKDVLARYHAEVDGESPAVPSAPAETKAPQAVAAPSPAPVAASKPKSQTSKIEAKREREKRAPKEQTREAPEENTPTMETQGSGVGSGNVAIAVGAVAGLALVGAILYGVLPHGGESPAKEVAVTSTPAETAAPTATSPTAPPTVSVSAPPPVANAVAPSATQSAAILNAQPPAATPAATGGRGVASPKATEKPQTKPASDSSAVETQDGHEVVIEAKERTWMKVVADDKKPVELFLAAGEKRSYKASTKIRIMLGNATGTVVTHNGKVDDGVKFEGTIRSYTFPTNAHFPQDSARRNTAAKSSRGESEESAPRHEDEGPSSPAAEDLQPVPFQSAEPPVIE